MTAWTDEMKHAAMADAAIVCMQATRIAELESALRPFAAVSGVGVPRISISPIVDRLWSYHDSRADYTHEITRAHVNEAARVLGLTPVSK